MDPCRLLGVLFPASRGPGSSWDSRRAIQVSAKRSLTDMIDLIVGSLHSSHVSRSCQPWPVRVVRLPWSQESSLARIGVVSLPRHTKEFLGTPGSWTFFQTSSYFGSYLDCCLFSSSRFLVSGHELLCLCVLIDCALLLDVCLELSRPFGQTHSSERGALGLWHQLLVWVGNVSEVLDGQALGEDRSDGKRTKSTLSMDIASKMRMCVVTTMTFTQRHSILSHGVRSHVLTRKRVCCTRSRKCILCSGCCNPTGSAS